MLFEVLLARKGRFQKRRAVYAESLCVEAPTRKAARDHLRAKYPGWDLLTFKPTRSCPRPKRRAG